MTIQQTGVQFINQGLSGAVNGLNQYNQAFVKTTQTVRNSTRSWNQYIDNSVRSTTRNVQNFGDTFKSSYKNVFQDINKSSMDASKNLNIFSNNVVNSANRIGGASGGILRFTGSIKNLILGMMGFYALKRIVNDILDSLGNLWKTMEEGASNTQLLTIRFQNLMAISIQNQQGIKDYGQALEMAKGPAADLLEWANQMAVKSIFSRDDVAQVLALGMAFDLTAGQSQTLTKAMMDWASGMGLGDDALQRMVVNFGQMMRMGKITQRELRDLAIGGLFPVNEALKRIGERAGLTGEALTKFMSDTATSGVPVNALLTEFVAIAGEKFPNAAEKMAKTWKGVTQNIKDFVTTILGAAILGPTMNKLVEGLSDLLDKALSPSVRGAANAIGEELANALSKIWNAGSKVIGVLRQLAQAFGIPIPSIREVIAAVSVLADYISQGMNRAVEAVQGWLTTTGKTFAEGASNFLQWGLEMVTQFAIGIIQGATTALAAAMDVIAIVLSFFLGPGSPPRVAPDIDKWGKAAMNEYLHGMTMADFDILNDLQGPLQSALNALAAMGKISKDSIGQIYANISQQIMKAMHQLETTGKVGEGVFKAIRKAGGMFGKELEELARKNFALLAAMKQVEKAQKALSEAQQADTAAQTRVSELTKEYRDLVEAGASKDILNAKRAEIAAAMQAHEQTQEEVSIQEQKVTAAEAALKPLEEQVKLQEKLVQEMIELANAQTKVAEAGAGAGGGGVAGMMGGLGDALKEFDTNMAQMRNEMAIKQIEFRESMEGTIAGIQKKITELFAPAKTQWEQDVKPAIDKITGSFNRLSGTIDKVLGKVTGEGSGFGGFIKDLGKIVGALAGVRIALGFLKWILAPITGLLGLFGVKGVAVVTVLKGIGSAIASVIGFIGGLSAVVSIAIAGIALFVVAMITNIGGLRDKVGALFKSIGNVLGAIFNAIGRAVEGILNLVVGVFNDVLDSITTLPGKAATSFTQFVTDVGTWINNIWTKFLELLPNITTTWQNFWNTDVGQFLKDIWEGATGILTNIGNWLATMFNTVINKISDLLGETGIPSFISKFVKAGEDLIMGIVTGIVNKAGDLLNAAVKAVTDAWNGMLDFLKIPHSPSGLGQEMGIDITQGISLGLSKGSTSLMDTMTGIARRVMANAQLVVQNDTAAVNNTSSNRKVSPAPVYHSPTFNNSRNYNLSMNTVKSSGNVARDFAIMETLAG